MEYLKLEKKTAARLTHNTTKKATQMGKHHTIPWPTCHVRSCYCDHKWQRENCCCKTDGGMSCMHAQQQQHCNITTTKISGRTTLCCERQRSKNIWVILRYMKEQNPHHDVTFPVCLADPGLHHHRLTRDPANPKITHSTSS